MNLLILQFIFSIIIYNNLHSLLIINYLFFDSIIIDLDLKSIYLLKDLINFKPNKLL